MDTATLDTAAEPFVYSCDVDDQQQAYLLKHRVFKRTSTRVYVTRAQGRREDWRSEALSRTFVLDRRALESDGGAWSHVTRTRYFLRAEQASGPLVNNAPSPALKALGLAPGASLLAIRQAYHRLALACHPDTGGAAAAFRTLREYYEQACREVLD